MMKESTSMELFTQMINEILPAVFKAMIEERDIHMSAAIMNQSDSRLLVGIVGLAHLKGINRFLCEKGGFQLVT